MSRLLKRLNKPTLHLDGLLHPDFKDVEITLRELLGKYAGGGAVCVYHRQCDERRQKRLRLTA